MKHKLNLLFLSMFYVAAGTNHFLMPEAYLPMMPEYLPWHDQLIFLSGVCEVLLGLLVLPDQTRQEAGIGLVLLLLAIFPANLHMALHPELFPIVSPWVLWLRLPFQLVLILWAWKTTAQRETPPLS